MSIANYMGLQNLFSFDYVTMPTPKLPGNILPIDNHPNDFVNWQDNLSELSPQGEAMYAANTIDYLNKSEQRDFYGLPIIKTDM